MAQDVAIPTLVSVIVLNFNGEKIIRKCLDHLLAQTYPNFEIIVVDNNSADGSLHALETYLSCGKLSIVRSKRNLGVPGGRNLGLLYAKGEIVAFIDNDGYASPTWLEEAIRIFESDDRVGAVASVVFFTKRKIILNGVGGTLNLQGYGGDICFNAPYEFAQFPSEVLYPMGCGMVIRKSVMERIGPLDALPFMWYEDVELGIRVWKLGLQVVVSPNAWIDHEFSYSDQFLQNKIYLCERSRIRTVLKYYPGELLIPWLFRERYFLRYLQSPTLWSIPLRAWGWNALHFPSAMKWRMKFAFKKNSFRHLLDPSWGAFPRPTANNHNFQPNLEQATHGLVMDGVSDTPQLNFGWYCPERDGPTCYRWTESRASVFFRFRSAVQTCSLKFRVPWPGLSVTFVLRRLGELDPTLKIPVHSPCSSWEQRDFSCNLGVGLYEMLFLTEGTRRDPGGRTLGVGVSSIEFR